MSQDRLCPLPLPPNREKVEMKVEVIEVICYEFDGQYYQKKREQVIAYLKRVYSIMEIVCDDRILNIIADLSPQFEKLNNAIPGWKTIDGKIFNDRKNAENYMKYYIYSKEKTIEWS